MTETASQPTITIDPAALDGRDAYRLMISIVTPRPIAWVSTLGPDGTRNLAPYSFFNCVGGPPLTVMFSVQLRKGSEKDTLHNLRHLGECVIHIVTEPLAVAMNETSGEYPSEIDEFERAGLAAVPSTTVRPPRIANAAAALECRLLKLLPVPDTTYTMVLCRVQMIHLAGGLLRPNGLVDGELLRPVGRLGGDEYSTAGRIFTLRRPIYSAR